MNLQGMEETFKFLFLQLLIDEVRKCIALEPPLMYNSTRGLAVIVCIEILNSFRQSKGCTGKIKFCWYGCLQRIFEGTKQV